MGKFLLPAILLSGILLLSCAPKAAPVEKASKQALEPAAVPKQPWEMSWEKTLKDAKKEGKVVLVGSIRPVFRDQLTRVFPAKFGIDVEVVSSTPTEMVRKMKDERTAGLYLDDIWLGGTTAHLLMLKDVRQPLEQVLVLPEVLKPEAWWGGGLRWIDKERMTLAFMAYADATLGVNTDIVRNEIKYFRDLLDTRWKGKIAMYDPTVSGQGLAIFGIMGDKVLGWDFWKQMIKQEPVITRDHRQMTEWLSRGKISASIGSVPEIFEDFIRAGAPIKAIVPGEGTYLHSSVGALSLIQNAPHPNAARVFINWLLTQEGQTIASKAMGTQSARIDVPTEHLSPQYVRQAGAKYIIGDDEEMVLKQAQHMKLAAEIFAPLMK